MIIENILKNEKLKYIKTDKKTFQCFEFENETLLITISNNKNIFKISRKDFYWIDNKLLPYAFCLIDSRNEQLYFVKIKEPNNFLRNAFEHTTKDEIYFGKEILQNKSNKNSIIENIKKIGEY